MSAAPDPFFPPADALARWRTGHRVFFVLIQGLIVALNCFDESIVAGDIKTARETLGLATSLMRGSAVALRYAGDFAPDDYETIVRPSMSPPHVSAGFSGLLSADHHAMIAVLARLKRVFAALPPGLAREHRRYVAAVDEVYEAHKWVCERFRGAEKPSLRMSATAGKSSLEVLDRFKRNRMHMAEAAGCEQARAQKAQR